MPADRLRQLKGELQGIKDEIQSYEEEIRSFASSRDELKFVADYYVMRAEKYGVLNDLIQSQNVFFITGYVPENQTEKLEQDLTQRYDAFVQFSDPQETEAVSYTHL